MRSPAALDAAIEVHKSVHGKEPTLIMIRSIYKTTHNFYFRGRLYSLCCGRGFLYGGIPAILTDSAMVEDFLLCY